MFSGLPWVIRLGDFSQGEEKGKKLSDMRKNEGEGTKKGEKGYVVPAGLCMCSMFLACARVRARARACAKFVCMCVYVHEVEKAVASWRGRALLSLAVGGWVGEEEGAGEVM